MGFLVVSVVFFFAVNLKAVGCTIIEPGELGITIGETASFKWNSTISADVKIVNSKWGLCTNDSNVVAVDFISAILNIAGKVDVGYNYAYLNTSQYYGRLEYVGDIKKGHAWFTIKNLKYEDAGPFCAELTEGPKLLPASTVFSRVTLKVLAVPTTSPTTTSPTTSTKTTPGSNITTTNTTARPSTTTIPSATTPTPKPTPKPGLNIGAIVGGVLGGLAGLLIGGLIGWWCWKKKKASHKGVRIPMTD